MDNRDESDLARSRLKQIFRFLARFNELQNPVECQVSRQLWSLRLGELPEHKSVVVSRPSMECSDSDLEGSVLTTEGSLSTFQLRVRKPVLSSCPSPPECLVEWLADTDWRDPQGAVHTHATRTESGPDGAVVTVSFESSPALKAALDEWMSKRARWAEIEGPARAAMNVYTQLYQLQARLDREFEEVELILGDGILVCEGPEGFVEHPILLQKVQLEFDPSVPEFTISEAEAGPELYSALLSRLFPQQATGIQRCIREVEEKGWHPVGGDETDAFLKRLATQLSPDAEFTGLGTPRAEGSIPRIGRDPIIFLRRRTLGFNTAIDDILLDLESGAPLPTSIAAITGVDFGPAGGPQSSEEVIDPLAANGGDEDILFGKEANEEQLKIAKRLDRFGAVLVQGPPGTGKTHTIANLIGHLLSQGKKVLVTSQTAKALKVLRDKVIETLQPLCVSLSQADSNQLDSAIDEITERLASWDKDSLTEEASVLEQRRLVILKELRKARHELIQAQQGEYMPVVVAGRSYTPSEAARIVAEDREECGWLPGPVKAGFTCPLSEEEVAELYSTNAVSDAYEREIALGVPDSAYVLAPSEFERLCAAYAELVSARTGRYEQLWSAGSEDTPPAALRDLLTKALRAAESLRVDDQWFLVAVQDGSGVGRSTWEEFIAQIERTVYQSRTAHAERLKHEVVVPTEESPDAIVQALEEIQKHVAQGGSLGFFTLGTHASWSRVLKKCLVDGRKPSSPEDIAVLLTQARLRHMRHQLAAWWNRLMTPLGAPSAEQLGGEPEVRARSYAENLKRAVTWFDEVWNPIERELEARGLDWKALLEQIPIEPSRCGDVLRIHRVVQTLLPEVIIERVTRLSLADLNRRLAALTEALERSGASQEPTTATSRLLDAVKQLDVERYRSCYDSFLGLKSASEQIRRRNFLLQKLEEVAPVWAGEIRNRRGIHGRVTPPGDTAKAWLWRQLDQELEERAKVPLAEVQERINQLTQELGRVTCELIEKRAWAAQLSNTSLEQRQALTGWKQLIKKAGRRKGKRAPRLLAEARRLMPTCQSAVPVWIMPLNIVVETFSPRRNRFDVVIIDEASQASILALAALYLGDRVVVVGDDKQVSPEAVGQRIDEIQALIDMMMKDVPNRHLYDGQTSIYDLAQTSFGGAVMLREHFRCVAPIIQFSNHLCYQGKIRPLRDDSDVQIKPPTVAYMVRGGFRDSTQLKGKVNPLEARTVAALVLSVCRQPEYSGKSLGVISMVGVEQAVLIDSLLQRYMDPGEYRRRQVLCGNPAHFQGDERDVIFLSMVDAPTGDGPLSYRSDPGDRFTKRFNVAASRPRDQLWVVHSVDPDIDLKPDDLRRRLILHARNPHALESYLATNEADTESEFERQVFRGLADAGYRVKAQYPVGGYRIDLVVEAGGKRLAIECDGDRFHTPDDLQADMNRQLILERLGWRFLRIRGSQFFRDPEGTLAWVTKRLKQLGVIPDFAVGEAEQVAVQEPLYDRVIRQAEEYLRDWDEGENSLSGGNLSSVGGRKTVTPVARSLGIPIAGVRAGDAGEVDSKASRTAELTELPEPWPIVAGTTEADEHAAVSAGAASEAGRGHVPTPRRPSIRRVREGREGGTQHTANQPTEADSHPLKGKAVAAPDPLLDAVLREGLEVVDNRAKGGALWVIGGLEVRDKIQRLSGLGYTFRHRPNGGRATRHRPSWWTSGGLDRRARTPTVPDRSHTDEV